MDYYHLYYLSDAERRQVLPRLKSELESILKDTACQKTLIELKCLHYSKKGLEQDERRSFFAKEGLEYLNILEVILSEEIPREHIPMQSSRIEEIRKINGCIDKEVNSLYNEIEKDFGSVDNLLKQVFIAIEDKSEAKSLGETKRKYAKEMEREKEHEIQRYMLLLKSLPEAISGSTLVYPFAGSDIYPALALFKSFKDFLLLDINYDKAQNKDNGRYSIKNLYRKLPPKLRKKVTLLARNCNKVENIVNACEIDTLFWKPSYSGEEEVSVRYIPKVKRTIIFSHHFYSNETSRLIRRTLRENNFKELIFADNGFYYEMLNMVSMNKVLSNFFAGENDINVLNPPYHLFVRK